MSDIIMPVVESVLLAVNIDEKSTSVVHAVQSDNLSRIIRVGFWDKDIEYVLDPESKVRFMIIRPDGIFAAKDCTINEDGNYAEVVLDENLLSVPGDARAGFIVWDKDQEQSIRSQEFTLHIGEKLDKDENLPTDAPVTLAVQVKKNTEDISKTKEELSDIVDRVTELEQDDGSGVTSGMAYTLYALLSKCAFISQDVSKEDNAFKSVWGVEGEIKVTGISLSSHGGTVFRGYSTTISAEVIPQNATNKVIMWESSDTSVATVTARGNVATINCISDGSAIITAKTVDGGFIDTFGVTVKIPVAESISLSSSIGDIKLGNTYTIQASILPVETEDKTVSWTTSDSTILSVTSSTDTLSCTVTANKVGSATITATTSSGKKATFTGTVVEQTGIPVTPTLLYRPSNGGIGGNQYVYEGDSADTVNKNDASTIKFLNIIRDRSVLIFDCTGARSVVIKRKIVNESYASIKTILYAYDKIPSFNQSYVSNPSDATTDVGRYGLMNGLPASSYMNPKPAVGDVVKVGEYNINPNFPYLIFWAASSVNDDYSTLEGVSYNNENEYFYFTSGDALRIEVIE